MNVLKSDFPYFKGKKRIDYRLSKLEKHFITLNFHNGAESDQMNASEMCRMTEFHETCEQSTSSPPLDEQETSAKVAPSVLTTKPILDENARRRLTRISYLRSSSSQRDVFAPDATTVMRKGGKEGTLGKSDSSRAESSWKLRKSSSASSLVKTPYCNTRRTPKNSCSSKFRNSECDSYILAVTEGRGQARGEVGIAGMDTQRPHLVLCQISDGQRYLNSLTKMNVFDFSEVIVPNTFVDCGAPAKLYADIRRRFPKATLTSVQRRHFNDATGIRLIRQYCDAESSSVLISLQDKFYALSAAAALIKYVEFTQNVALASGSLRVEYQGMEDTMLIDLDTANHLELVLCLRHPEVNPGNSLLGVVNHCRTKGGARLLKANILQPFSSVRKINGRLSCVEELVNSPILCCALEAPIANFANVESLLNLCMHAPQRDDLRTAEHHLKYTLLLKTTLELLPKLISPLEITRSDHFRHLLQILKDPRFNMILERMSETLFEHAGAVRGSVAAHLHGCFAVKPGVNALLDVAKKTYCEIVQDITDHVAGLREKYDLPVRVSFSANKGFHLRCVLPGEAARCSRKTVHLPGEFILVAKSKNCFTFYTASLVALDKRSQHVLEEIKLMTNTILVDLLADVRPHAGCLFNLCEVVAELDLLVSFAHVSSATGYVKPTFGHCLDLERSRHPILDGTGARDTVPNDVLVSEEKNFLILTGPNQSGKSVYIRQVALLQVMAQIGCFIPAARAKFKVCKRLFSRVGFDDNLESNASTMIVEMRDVEYIRQNLTSDSIVIVDELCRGTSTEEGTSLAFAICEQMLDSSAFVLFTTHYILLTKLEELYPNVANFHFECELSITNDGHARTRFDHLLKPGCTTSDSQGLKAAELTSFPKDVWARAEKIASLLRRNRKPEPDIGGLLPGYAMASRLKKELAFAEMQTEDVNVSRIVRAFKRKYQVMSESRKANNFCEAWKRKKQECAIGTRSIVNRPFPMDSIFGTTFELTSFFREESVKKAPNKEVEAINKAVKKIKKKYKKLRVKCGNNRPRKCPGPSTGSIDSTFQVKGSSGVIGRNKN